MRNDNCKKKKLSDNVSNVFFFFSFFLTCTNCQTEYLPTLFSDSIQGEEMTRRVPYMYERHLPLQNWGDVLCPCKREVPNLASSWSPKVGSETNQQH